MKDHHSMSPLSLGAKVADALVQIVRGATVRLRYLIAKGGITSLEGAIEGLMIGWTAILGLAAPAIPLWRCTEETSRFPDLPYVVFPRNVGNRSPLTKLVKSWLLNKNRTICALIRTK
jgi:uncharacterized protein YgbK (DUF1537 family)